MHVRKYISVPPTVYLNDINTDDILIISISIILPGVLVECITYFNKLFSTVTEVWSVQNYNMGFNAPNHWLNLT